MSRDDYDSPGHVGPFEFIGRFPLSFSPVPLAHSPSLRFFGCKERNFTARVRKYRKRRCFLRFANCQYQLSQPVQDGGIG